MPRTLAVVRCYTKIQITVSWFKRNYGSWIPKKVPRPDETFWEEKQIYGKVNSQLATWRPLLPGNDIDEKVRKFIMTLLSKGGQATFSISIPVAKALIEQSDKKSLKVLKFGKD